MSSSGKKKKGSNKGTTRDELGELPEGWKTRMDEAKGRRIYYNRDLGLTQWLRPKPEGAAPSPTPGPEPVEPAVSEGEPPASAGNLVLSTGKKSVANTPTPELSQEQVPADEPTAQERPEGHRDSLHPLRGDGDTGARMLEAPIAEAPSPAEAQPPLPEGWAIKISGGGEQYYMNELDGTTQWDMPTTPAQADGGLERPTLVEKSETASPEPEPEPESEPEPALEDAPEQAPEQAPEPEAAPEDVESGVGTDAEEKAPLTDSESYLTRDEHTDELLGKYCRCVPQPLRHCMSAVWTSCIWMVLRTLWDVVPWLVPFGFFMQSLSLKVDSEQRGQLVVLLLFLATPVISMRYHGKSETTRHTLGDGWNIAFVALGTLLTVLFVQIFLFILYDDIDSFLELDLGSSNETVAINETSFIDPLQFSSAVFAGELLPEQFGDILDKYTFGKVFLAAPPAVVVVLIGLKQACSCHSRSSEALSSELYSVGFFLWFYSAWLMLMHTKSDADYFASKTTEELRQQVQSIDSVETVSYLVNAAAIVFTSFSIAVQESSEPTTKTNGSDISKPLPSKSFSTGLGVEGMFWLACMWINGTIALLSTFSWTYRRQDASIWPYFLGLPVSFAYMVVYWYHVVWWYAEITAKHKHVTDILAQKHYDTKNTPRCMDCVPSFQPESDHFYSKQAFCVVADLLSQTGRSWLFLAVAAGNRFGYKRDAQGLLLLGLFIVLVLIHTVFSILMVVMKRCNGSNNSPYARMRADLLFEQMFIFVGMGISVHLWNQSSRGLPLCSAFSADWSHVVTTFVPLLLALWALPTAITRAAIFTPEKRPSERALKALFNNVNKDVNNSSALSKNEIGDLCDKLGIKLTPTELTYTMAVLDLDKSEDITFDEFKHWATNDWDKLPKLKKAMARLKANALMQTLKDEKKAPKPLAKAKIPYLVLLALCIPAVIFVFVRALIMDEEMNRLPFHSSMDQGMVHTTNATFSSTFEDYDELGVKVDTTASFIVLDKYTALRFEDVDLPSDATVTSAVISFAPYLPADESNPSQTDYCVETNDLGGSGYPTGVTPTRITSTDNSISVGAGLTEADLDTVVAGQRMRLDGASCPAGPKGKDLIVQSVSGTDILFETDIELSGRTSTNVGGCRLRRPVCTSPMQINQGNLRVKAHMGEIDTSTDPPPQPVGAVAPTVKTVPFVGAQNFAISGLEAMVTNVIDAPSWASGNPMQFYLELLPSLSAVDGAPAQVQSASCVAAEPAGTSCYFPKQLLAASCDSLELTVKYMTSDGTDETTAASWPKAPFLF